MDSLTIELSPESNESSVDSSDDESNESMQPQAIRRDFLNQLRFVEFVRSIDATFERVDSIDAMIIRPLTRLLLASFVH